MATEKRMIDANPVIDKLKSHHDLFVDAWGGFGNLPEKDKARVDEISSCIAELFNAPTVDAVEVVLCKDCKKWFRHTEVDRERGECRRYQTTKHEAGFCDRGERKDNVL